MKNEKETIANKINFIDIPNLIIFVNCKVNLQKNILYSVAFFSCECFIYKLQKDKYLYRL